jgi:hypothetical protein
MQLRDTSANSRAQGPGQIQTRLTPAPFFDVLQMYNDDESNQSKSNQIKSNQMHFLAHESNPQQDVVWTQSNGGHNEKTT